jgi:CheY-like chemotaxis protein
MTFSAKISVLELLHNLIHENEKKLESLIEKIEVIDQTIQQNPNILKKMKEHYPSITKTQNILVVDDDTNLANTFKLVLESVGYNVDTALTGIQALYKVKHGYYNLILLDLNLPDIMGDKLAEMIEDHHSHIKILFITGYQELKDKIDGDENEKEILLKPISSDVLLEATSSRLALTQTHIESTD